MRVLGIDLGAKRIGLAISGPDGSIALPLGVQPSKGRAQDLAALCDIISERCVERVVVGLPLHMDGRKGPEAERALDFANALSEAAGLIVDTLDERWSTVEAHRALHETGRRRKQHKQVVDSVAASLILDTYLQLLSNDTAPSNENVRTDDAGEDA